jgi:hypothetical protein
MKQLRDCLICGFIIVASFCLGVFVIEIENISSDINRATNYILSTQEIVSGQDHEINELREMIDRLNNTVYDGEAVE